MVVVWNTDAVRDSLAALEEDFARLRDFGPGHAFYRMARSACVKDFEVVSEQCARLLQKRIRGFFFTHREADQLNVKDVFRHAVKHAVISGDACERWLRYRDLRNDSAHEYGETYAEQVLAVLPAFIEDAQALERAIAQAGQ